MSKNVLVISSSPRKGDNSDTLCNEFIRGANEYGNNTSLLKEAYAMGKSV